MAGSIDATFDIYDANLDDPLQCAPPIPISDPDTFVAQGAFPNILQGTPFDLLESFPEPPSLGISPGIHGALIARPQSRFQDLVRVVLEPIPKSDQRRLDGKVVDKFQRSRHAEGGAAFKLSGQGFPVSWDSRYLVIGASGNKSGSVNATLVYSVFERMVAIDLQKPTPSPKHSYPGLSHDEDSTVTVDLEMTSSGDYVVLWLWNKRSEYELAAVPVKHASEPWLWAKTVDTLKELMDPDSEERLKFDKNQQKRLTMNKRKASPKCLPTTPKKMCTQDSEPRHASNSGARRSGGKVQQENTPGAGKSRRSRVQRQERKGRRLVPVAED